MRQVEIPDKIVSIPAFMDQSTFSRSMVYKLIRQGDLPRPIKLSANRVGWPKSVIDDFWTRRLQPVAA